MKLKNKIIIISFGLSLLLSASLSAEEKELTSSEIQKKAKSLGLIAIPETNKEKFKLINTDKYQVTKDKFVLGKKLFFDPRLSKSGIISCNTCHNLGLGGVDGVSVAIGDKWNKNPHELNSPTVYNAVFNKKQFWDGRSPDLEDQATGPIQASPEMAATPEHVKNLVNSVPEYLEAFRKIKNDDKYIPTIKDVGEMIGAFERTLVTISRYDGFINGNMKALSTEEQKGLNVFIDKGCISCHGGINLGGDMAPFPVVAPYKYASGDFKGDKNGMVKVPTLRNIDKTAPYFHNGKVWSLSEAVDIMAETQLGMTLTKEENKQIVLFLKSLSGERINIYPELPVRNKDTDLPLN